MSLWNQIRRVFVDPPPAYAFEVSPAGIAYSRAGKEPRLGFQPLDPGVLAVSPLRDNVLRPEVLFERVRALAPENGKGPRTAAVILPDYCARVAVLDFDSFPPDKAEQLSLVRFRMKKGIPFDLESATVSYFVQTGHVKKHEVVAVAAALAIVARYEAAFRQAGFQPGYVTTSTLASLPLLPDDGVTVFAKLSGSTLTVAVLEAQSLRLLRCVDLPEISLSEVAGVLYPTLAYVEDELGSRPDSLVVSGFGDLTGEIHDLAGQDLALPVADLRSRLGVVEQTNAGLLGFVEMTKE
mgnify:CR=1 FL=1